MTASKSVTIVTLPGFNEIDSFTAARMIHSVPLDVELVGPESTAVSMAGIEVATPAPKLRALGVTVANEPFRSYGNLARTKLSASASVGTR